MSIYAPPVPVDAPPIRPAVGGLIAYADKPGNTEQAMVLVPGGTIPAPRPEAWEAGFAFDPYTCDPAIIVPLDCESPWDPEPGDAAKLDAIGAHPGIVTYIPFQIVAADECSALSFEQLEARARSMLNVSQSYTLESEFWTGEGVPTNPSLTDGNATVLGGGAVGLQEALALIDQAVTESEQGAPGMIHVTPYMLATIVDSEGGAIRWAGDRYVTANGNVIVPGSGYTGGAPRPAPAGVLPAPPDLLAHPPANQWIYGTGTVVVRLGAVISVTPDRVSQLNRASNRDRWIFERSAAAYASPCTQFTVEVDLTPA